MTALDLNSRVRAFNSAPCPMSCICFTRSTCFAESLLFPLMPLLLLLSHQLTDSPESIPKMKRSFYAARDLYKYRHSYPVPHTATETNKRTQMKQLTPPVLISFVFAHLCVELQKVAATQRVPEPALLPEQDSSGTRW